MAGLIRSLRTLLAWHDEASDSRGVEMALLGSCLSAFCCEDDAQNAAAVAEATTQSVKALLAMEEAAEGKTAGARSTIQMQSVKRTAFKFLLAAFQDSLTLFDARLELVRVLEGLLKAPKRLQQDMAPEELATLGAKLSVLARGILREDWGKECKGANLAYLIRAYIGFARVPLDVVEELVHDVFPRAVANDFAVIQPDEIKAAEVFRTMNEKTFPSYFSSVLSSLISMMKKNKPGQDLTDTEPLLRWEKLVKCVARLVKLASKYKVAAGKKIQAAACKNVHLMLVELLRQVPYFTAQFGLNTPETIAFFESVQTCTRKALHIGAHGKDSKISAIVHSLPQLKKHIELFTQKVKEIINANDSLAGFALKKLKGKKLLQSKSPSPLDE
jgi:hypothetical protein